MITIRKRVALIGLMAIGLYAMILFDGCFLPFGSKSSSSSKNGLKISLIIQGTSASSSAKSTRLLLPTAHSLKVSLAAVDSWLTAPTDQTATIGASQTIVSVSFPSVQLGHYTITAQAFDAAGNLAFRQSSPLTLSSASASVTLNMVPVDTTTLPQLARAQSYSGSLAAGTASTWLVPAGAAISSSYGILITADPSILFFAQDSAGALLNPDPSVRALSASQAAGSFLTLYNPGSTDRTVSFVFSSVNVVYDPNGATSGSAPADLNPYAQGQTVTVIGNTGSLAKVGFTFTGWNTAANGSGTSYETGATLAMGSANLVLFAKWSSGVSLNAKWYVAKGIPAAGTGSNGDLFLDTDTTILYVNVSGSWTMVSQLRGAKGSGWIVGTGTPSAGIGTEGDLYLDSASTIAYEKISGTWTTLFTLKGTDGATGVTGSNGTNGTDGTNGINGTVWFTGSGDPNLISPPTAATGDLYLDTRSGIVYRMTSSSPDEWTLTVSFQAALVPQYIFTPIMTNLQGINAVAYGLVGGATGTFVGVGDEGTIIASTDGSDWNWIQGGANQLLPSGINHGKSAKQRSLQAQPGAFPIYRTPAGTVPLRKGAKGLANGSAPSYDPINGGNSLYGVAFGNGLFVAVGQYYSPDDVLFYSIFTSQDGDTWELRMVSDGAIRYTLYGVVFQNNEFLAYGTDSTRHCVLLTSGDGVTWTDCTPTQITGDYIITSIAYGGGEWAMIVENWGDGFMGTFTMTTASTPSANSWTEGSGFGNYYSDQYHLYSVAYNNGTFVAVGNHYYANFVYGTSTGLPLSLIMTSKDGAAWTTQDIPVTTILDSVAGGPGGFIAVGRSGYIFTSPNGTAWSVQSWSTNPFNFSFCSVAEGTVTGSNQPVYVVANGNGWYSSMF